MTTEQKLSKECIDCIACIFPHSEGHHKQDLYDAFLAGAAMGIKVICEQKSPDEVAKAAKEILALCERRLTIPPPENLSRN